MSFKYLKISTLLLALLQISSSSAQDHPFHYRYDQWQIRALQYGGLRAPASGLLLSDQLYTPALAETVFTRLFPAATSSLAGYYGRRLWDDLTYFRKPGRVHLTWRMNSRWSSHPGPREALKIENDLIGLFRISHTLSAVLDFQGDTDGLADSDYHGIYEWKNELTGDMRAAYLVYSADKWSILVGRDYLHWGPGRTGALLTSGYAPALDMVKFTADIGRVRFQGFNSLLVRGSEREEAERVNRYFSGHRLSLRLNRAEFGVSETIMYGGPQEIVDPGYLNFLIPYYLTDVMQVQERNDNVTVALDAAVWWPRNWRLYGQLLVDEYYYEGEDFPARTAFLAGVDWTGLSRLWLNAEYVKIDRWTYNYDAGSWWNRLNYFNTVLGHPLGPDADQLHIEAEYCPAGRLVLRGALDLIQRGETTIYTDFRNSDLAQQHNAFPSGVVQRSGRYMLQAEWAPNRHWLLRLTGEHTVRRNSGNISGAKRSTSGVRLEVRSFLHTRL